MSGRPARRSRTPSERATAVEQPRSLDLRGSLDSVERDGRAYGWCWSPDEPAQRRAITLRINGAESVTATADVLRTDLLAAGIGDGGHGFVAAIPASLRPPGQTAIIRLQDVASGQPVGGETRVAWQTETVPVVPLAGNLDLVTRDGWVTGWCWEPSEPSRRLLLDILLDGEGVGSAEAAESRADLHQAGVGDGRYGFSFMLPYEVLAERGTVEIRVVGRDSRRPLGEPATMRIGRRVEADTRILELERRVALLQGQLRRLTSASAQQPEAEARAARRMFALVAEFFQDLADDTPHVDPVGTRPGRVEHTFEALRRTLTPLTLRTPATEATGRPMATVAVAATAPVEDVHACLFALAQAGVDRLADIVLLDPFAGHPGCALLPALVPNLRAGPAEGNAVAGFARLLREADTRLVGLVVPHIHLGANWLERLAATLDCEPSAAIVGSAVIRPDGLLQDAGFSLDDQLRLRSRGHLAQADLPEQRFMRPVEAIGAWALLADPVRIAQVGGLDPAYLELAPAIADLCLRLRANAGSVLLQPSAAVAWAAPEVEAIAPDLSGTGDDANRLHLAILRHARASQPLFLGHALVVDSHLPRPDRDAGSVVAFEQMLVLRRLGWRVTFAAAATDEPSLADRERLEHAGIEVAPTAEGGVTDYLREAGSDLQLVHLYRHKVAALLLPRVRELAPGARIVFSPADLHFVREAREAALHGQTGSVSATRSQELSCVHQADATILLSDYEQRLLASEVDAGKLHVLRWIARPQAQAGLRDHESRQGALFIGHFGHAPNVDAVIWYAQKVCPILQRIRPGLTLDVIGDGAPPSVMALQSNAIRVRGWISDLRPTLAQARLTIAPLRFGAGFKGKVATSLCAGVPVVGTSIAFEGTGLAEGDGIALADDAEAFAVAIAAIHDDADRWNRLSKRAVERVAALYSPQAAASFFRSLLNGLGLPVGEAD